MRDSEHLDGGLGVVETEEPEDAAAAFEALRASVERVGREVRAETALLRDGVAAALEHTQAAGTPVDYSADLGRLVQEFATVSKRLGAIERLPVLRQDAQQTARLLHSSGEALVRDSVRKLDARAEAFLRETQGLTGRMRSLRERREQNLWLTGTGVGAGAAGLFLGVVLILTLPALLPYGAAERVAASILGEEPWQAGIRLMKFGSPVGLSQLGAADRLMRANAEVVTACREAATKAGKDQPCTITVAVPAK
ncbi:hypothetical protein ASG60_20840 [Methylobacterium sp. Leaf469]|uniref:DUF6118 family protein n=1 Tax=Methylobacterium sp. Leaf469 TaxID=1736387 RepID=UPI0006FC12B8|nr:DUF6118 family protein [Methylobacterium sp. Leaf469]KQT95715.1 hypothetical protein ASG60_20840 [Methylobacterium sp. Leaf469]